VSRSPFLFLSSMLNCLSSDIHTFTFKSDGYKKCHDHHHHPVTLIGCVIEIKIIRSLSHNFCLLPSSEGIIFSTVISESCVRNCVHQLEIIVLMFFSCVMASKVRSISLISAIITIVILSTPSEASIGYFESYGWPSYGIVKPFWMAPFSAHPSRSISPYSKKHNVVSAGIISGPSSGMDRRRRRRRSLFY